MTDPKKPEDGQAQGKAKKVSLRILTAQDYHGKPYPSGQALTLAERNVKRWQPYIDGGHVEIIKKG